MIEWHLLTGEYPPQPGGVSDYTHQLARGLAESGDRVEVWAPTAREPDPADPGVRVHRLPDCFGPCSLRLLSRALRHPSPARRLVVQYVPHAFGWKGMNLAFCWWLYRHRRRERIRVMFHEVVFPLSRRQPLRHNFLGCVNRLMAALVSRGAGHCFVSTPSWVRLVRCFHPRGPIEWLPIPSNIPTEVPAGAAAAARACYGAGVGETIVGHFGTYGSLIAPLVEAVLPGILAGDPRRIGLLIGRGSDRFLPQLLQARPALAGRVFATGALAGPDLAAHLAGCDLLIQPYGDGVTTRRTSLMAGLALGVQVVTTSGPLTESLWQEEGLVALAPVETPAALIAVAEALLSNTPARCGLGRRGRTGYRRLFSIERTVQAFRQAEACLDDRHSSLQRDSTEQRHTEPHT